LHPKGKPKQFTLQGGILNEFLVGGNTKHTHLTGGNDLLTLDYLISPILDFLDFSFFSTGLAYTSSPFVSYLFSLYNIVDCIS
jgi:hypothetical protein